MAVAANTQQPGACAAAKTAHQAYRSTNPGPSESVLASSTLQVAQSSAMMPNNYPSSRSMNLGSSESRSAAGSNTQQTGRCTTAITNNIQAYGSTNPDLSGSGSVVASTAQQAASSAAFDTNNNTGSVGCSPDMRGNFKCPVCGMTSTSWRSMKYHMRQGHGILLPQMSDAVIPPNFIQDAGRSRGTVPKQSAATARAPVASVQEKRLQTTTATQQVLCRSAHI